MSKVSYIAFPRRIDTTTIESGVIALKSYLVGELIWGSDGKSVIRNTSNIGIASIDSNELQGGGFFHGLRVSEVTGSPSFKKCFKNKYIYALHGSLNYSGESRSSSHSCKTGTESELVARLTKGLLVNIELCRKQLRDLLIHNLNEGEFVEIYSEFVNHTDFSFGPPKNELLITIGEILFSSELDLTERLRIEIKC